MEARVSRTQGLVERRRVFGRRPVTRPWTIGFLGAPAIGIVNGIVRRAGYEHRVGELAAHQIATALYLLLFAGYVSELDRRHPLPSRAAAVRVGAAWAAGSIAFEFIAGHYVNGDSWSTLLQAYDVTTGHVWLAVPLWIASAPLVIRERRLRRPRRDD
jgi:hypothetical protein